MRSVWSYSSRMIWSLVELMLREKVRYARLEMRLPIVRRAEGLKRDDCCVGSLTSGVSWKVSTPNVCSTTSPIWPEMGLTNMRATRACTSCCSVMSGLERARRSASSPVARSPSSSDATSTCGNGGSELNTGRSRCIVPDALSMTR